MTLYRIKPLEWRIDHDGRLGAGSYKISVSGSYYWGWSISSDWTSLLEDTEDEAKAACEAHRRKLLEAELEPAYQPSTELPTEPGLYWFRKNDEQEWDHRKIIQTREKHLVIESGPFNWYAPRKGQWVRIPEPEVER